MPGGVGHPQRESSPAWGKDRTRCEGAHGPLNQFPLLAACQRAGLPASPGAGWPRIFHLYPHKEELSVTFCHRGNWVQAALGMTCCESCEEQPLPIGEKKKLFLIRGSCPMALPLTRPCSPKGGFCAALHWQTAASPPGLLYSSYCPHPSFPFNSRQQWEERVFRMRGKTGQSLRRNRSVSFLTETLPLCSPTTTRAGEGEEENSRAGFTRSVMFLAADQVPILTPGSAQHAGK